MKRENGTVLVRDPQEVNSMSRRELLKLAPLLALSAIAVPTLRERILREGLELSDRFSEATFRQNHLAPTYSDAKVDPLGKFPFNSYDMDDPEIDLATWTFSVSGLVRHPGEYRLEQIQALPKVRHNTRHVCIEGWSVIGSFGGARLSDFLDRLGADPMARFLEFTCADDYYESISIEDARHPQTLLCYEMYGQPLGRGHGAPLRLQMPTKLGYKQAKYLTGMKVTSILSPRRGYWEDLGYSWHGGL